eukprot:CAMPEP_0198223386 /NCGR_PEP_ID=MMETSP1445-20131203/92339_1 /TAXON_ID=36898 /ORGANISM="Pyramimonas sp., Strain CCMP2087" /LENGTH=120 /DNA_ID=CAMNT_0043902209 /DNA_START=118 /DNA_END=477 /DNA_ORIENTATION=+
MPLDVSANQMDLDIHIDWKHQRTGLYFGASKIAALAGYNPWSDLPQLFHESIYQGRLGAALLRKDCQLLGIEIVDAGEELSKIVEKAGPEAKRAIEIALAAKTGETVVRNTSEADHIKAQ